MLAGSAPYFFHPKPLRSIRRPIALENTMLLHAITINLNEEGRCWIFKKMFIKAEVCCGADDCEHGVMVSRRFVIWMPETKITIRCQTFFQTGTRYRVPNVVNHPSF